MKRIFTSVMIVLASSFTFAQTVKFGVKGGLNISHLSWKVKSANVSADITNNSRASFYLGSFAESAVSDRVSLQAEFQFSVNAGNLKASNRILDLDEDVLIRSFNFNIPILAKLQIIEGFKLNAGGYFGMNLLTQGKNNIDSGEGWQNLTSDDIGKINFLRAGLLVGVEYNFPNGLFVEGRYNHGLTNVFKIQVPAGTILHHNGFGGYYYTTQYIDMTAKDRFIQLGIGYKF
jgi:hypothetical protein